MNVEEYRTNLLEDIRVNSQYEMSNIQSEFIKCVSSILIDAEEFDDFIEGYFEGTADGNKKMMIDGYYFDPFDKSCVLLIGDFTNLDNATTIINSDIEKLYDRMENFVEASVNGYIMTKGFAESSNGYGLAKELYDNWNNITKLRFYIVTDKMLNVKIKNSKRENIFGKSVELNVWDINRLHMIYSSTLGKESIEIDFSSLKGGGIPCVKAVECEDEYSAYLAVISGEVLASMYIQHGSRLLEGNVRSFLSVKGKVNKEIRNTILNEPDMFFAYNNGIAATATSANIIETHEGLFITKLVDLQIINGGQTTASIANAVLQDKKDVSNVYVPMKLSVVDHDKATHMIPIISRCANSQNKVDEADFFSNSPYHIRMEEFSRKILAPPVDGSQIPTVWFYERARGQYVQAQMKLTPSERKKFQIKNPKNQLIKKVDLAKYINTYEGLPHIVSRGAQACMRSFAASTEKEWEKSNTSFNEYYYKKVIALAIMFKNTEELVSNQQWYKEIKAYRANIVTYALSIIFNIIRENYPNTSIDFKRIWNAQRIYPELEMQLAKTTEEVLKFITKPDRATLNVTEWCKQLPCWERSKKYPFELMPEFVNTLVSSLDEKNVEIDARKDQKVINELSAEIEVVKLGDKYWNDIMCWANERKLLTPIERDLLSLASTCVSSGRVPSTKQAKVILDIRQKLYREGLPKKNNVNFT